MFVKVQLVRFQKTTDLSRIMAWNKWNNFDTLVDPSTTSTIDNVLFITLYSRYALKFSELKNRVPWKLRFQIWIIIRQFVAEMAKVLLGYPTWNGVPAAPGWKNMLSNVTSRYKGNYWNLGRRLGRVKWQSHNLIF
jgi:hypothetical protein